MKKIYQFIKFKYLILKLIPAIFILFLLGSCKKDWLNAKPDSHLTVITTLQDVQALLDNASFLMTGNSISEAATDNTYLVPGYEVYFIPEDKDIYTWAPKGWSTSTSDDWAVLYKTVFVCNTALKSLNNITPSSTNLSLYNQLYGTALFIRATAYYNLGQTFCKPYNVSTANTDFGVPLRLTADIAEKVGRGTVNELYNQIITDFKQATNLLSDSGQLYISRPTKRSSISSLARTYLAMGDFKNALTYAESSLKINNNLLDYNTITPQDPTVPFPSFSTNPEIITFGVISTDLTEPYYMSVDSILYQSYSNQDLRKTLFFNVSTELDAPYLSYVGSYYSLYSGEGANYTGIANDELYLIKSECEVRAGDITNAMADLNALLVKRFKTGTFVPLSAANTNDALNEILTERRKELFGRGVRWTDLRRLNSDPTFAKTIVHVYSGQSYTLQPNSNLYVFPIPDNEIQVSGIPQNPR